MVVFDTCALLDLYNLSDGSLEKVLDFLEEKKDDIFLPFQVYYEFCKHYKEVRGRVNTSLERNKTDISNLLNKIDTVYDKVIDQYRQYDSKIFEIVEEAKKNHEKYQLEIEKEINKIVANNTKTIDDLTDSIYVFVQSLYSVQAPKDFTITDKIRIAEEAKLRYSYGFGPGFTDKCKKDDVFAPYGDYFIFKQILNKMQELHQDLILITDENKPDWRETKGSNNPTLIIKEDFLNICPNNTVQIQFLNEYLEENINDGDLKAELRKRKYLLNLVRSYDKSDVLVDSCFQEKLENQIDDYLLSKYLSGEAAGMGSIGDVEITDLALDKINCKPFYFNDINYIHNVDVELVYTVKINCEVNVSRDYDEYGTAEVIFTQKVNVNYDVFIEYSENNNIDYCFKLRDYNLIGYDVKLKDYVSNEAYEDLDEDIYCLECGKALDFGRDTVEDYCVNCSRKIDEDAKN